MNPLKCEPYRDAWRRWPNKTFKDCQTMNKTMMMIALLTVTSTVMAASNRETLSAAAPSVSATNVLQTSAAATQHVSVLTQTSHGRVSDK
jgi:hypothetical protein